MEQYNITINQLEQKINNIIRDYRHGVFTYEEMNRNIKQVTDTNIMFAFDCTDEAQTDILCEELYDNDIEYAISRYDEIAWNDDCEAVVSYRAHIQCVGPYHYFKLTKEDANDFGYPRPYQIFPVI